MSMIYQKAEAYGTTSRTQTRVARPDRTIRESAGLFKQAVVATIGCIGLIAWAIALGALI